MAKELSQTTTHERVDIKEPRRWAVIFWNDDFTTMDFVVEVLEDIFLKTRVEAESLMLKVHEQGQAVVGTYSYDVAVTRTEETLAEAREAGFPLKVTYKEA